MKTAERWSWFRQTFSPPASTPLASISFISAIFIWPVLILTACIYLPPASANASNTPILQIDSGGHKAKIKDVIFTKDGKQLVSASNDKTVRVWDVETGKILHAIRGQIEKGDEGKIYAAALSPDNRWLAVGGLLTGDIENKTAIRLMDFQTGKIDRLLKGHGDVIAGLSFSKNNRFLISGSGDSTARIWDISAGKTRHTLTGHTDDIYAVAFSPDSSLAVTGSDDHTLKLWRVSDGSLVKTLTGHDDKVRSVAFTPDGQYILSGSKDKTIRMWDGNDGAFIKILAKQNRNVSSLSMSSDGNYVVTGCGPGNGERINNIFSIPSGKNITRFDKHKNIVLATAISPDNSTVATGGGDDQEIYLWDIKTGKDTLKMAGNGNVAWSVGFARDGNSIAWGNAWGSRSLFKYGSLQKSFIIANNATGMAPGPALSSDDGYIRGIEKIGDISIRTQNGDVHPTLEILKNGAVAHKITRGQTDGGVHESLTLSPDGATVISGGGNGFLTSYDTNTGQKLKKFIGHTSDVWGVAISADGQRLVSGSVDQTVRVWDVKTAKPLMTLFYGSDDEWVAWTPEGFYAASENGEQYIGYHINNGEARAADYVRVDQVGDIFYRPDLVAKKVSGGFEEDIQLEVARLGDIRTVMLSGLPPEIRIQNPQDTVSVEKNVTVKFSMTVKKGGRGRIEYRINGALVRLADRGTSPMFVNDSRIIEMEEDITLPAETNRIEIIAYNRNGNIASTPVSITVRYKNPLNEAPSLYALAVGVTEYEESGLNLKHAAADALALKEKLKNRGDRLFKTIDIKTLTNQDATRENIRREFLKMAGRVQTSDVFILYLAGHAKSIGGDYYFIPHDALYENEESFKKASVSHKLLISLMKEIVSLKTLIIMDTCYAGEGLKLIFAGLLLPSRGSAGLIDEKSAIQRLTRSSGRSILAATSGKNAQEGKEGHGFFTWALLQGLSGKADRKGDGKGTVNTAELSSFVAEIVPEITEKTGYKQIPMNLTMGAPFPISCAQGYEKPNCVK